MLEQDAYEIYNYLRIRKAEDFKSTDILQSRYPERMTKQSGLRRNFRAKALKFEIVEDDLFKKVKQVTIFLF